MSERNDAGTVERPISAWLATVLAAAAKGAQPGRPVYVVARYEPDLTSLTTPFDVHRPVPTREEAEQIKILAEERHQGVAYGIFGPYVNDGPVLPLGQDRVASIVVTTTNGHTLNIDGTQYDALFYSYQAVEKFALPLYVQEYGPVYAGQLLDKFNLQPLALMAHLPWSEEVLLMDNPTDPTPHGIPVFLTPRAGTEADHQPFPPPPPQTRTA